jgi:shikimate kinase
MKTTRIVIVGFMCAGKTTVARALARQLNCEMIDLDALIVEHERRTVPELITAEGEAAFRRMETYVLRIALERKLARVVALGGGAWTIAENRALIAEHKCLSVWLDAPFNLCWQRITAEQPQTRPLALDRKTTHELYEARRALYELATLRVQVTEDSDAETLAAEIVRAMRRQRF